MDATTRRRVAPAAAALMALCALACAVLVWCLAAPASAAGAPRGYVRVEPVCPPPAPGEASCFALAAVPVSAAEAGAPGVRPLAARPAAVEVGPAGGPMTPKTLASAYGYDPNAGGAGQTIAIVDAFDDPNIESDLAAFSENYGLAPCTTGNGCFEKVGQSGSPEALPEPDRSGWSVEVSLDVETAHSACPKCRILLVESDDAFMTDLAAAVRTAGQLGAQEISNSYGAPEEGPLGAAERAAYNRPGVVVADRKSVV